MKVFHNKFLASIWFVAVFVGSAHAQTTVSEIIVEGNQRVEVETIRSYMELNPGDPIDIELVDDSIKRLFETGFFADVSVRREGTALIVTVVENPVINQIAFEGNRLLDSVDLEGEISLKPRLIYTPAKVRDDVQRLIEIYRRTGRFNATVEPKIILQDQNRVDLVFEISEGDATIVREINFVGNAGFSDSTLRDEIVTKESAWYRFLSTVDSYDPDRLAFDRELLRRFYLSEGYVDVEIVAAVAEFTPGLEEFFVTFSIDEGPRYEVGEISVTSELGDVAPDDVLDLISFDTGDWYDADLIEDDILDMTVDFGQRGISFVEINYDVIRDPEAQIVDLQFMVVRGPAVYVERIDIIGNVRTTDEVIRREVLIVEGDALNFARMQRSERQIRALDYFTSVSVSTEPGSSDDLVIITIAVEEKSTGQLSFGIGYSSLNKGLITISLSERNLLGNGQTLAFDLELSNTSRTFELDVVEPYFLDRDLAAGVNIVARRLDRTSTSSFEQEVIGGSVRLGYQLARDLRHTVAYLYQFRDILNVQATASPFIASQEGQTHVSAVSQWLIYDKRDDVIFPTEGYMLRHYLEVAGLGGDTRYASTRMIGTYHYPFGGDWILDLRLDAGIIDGLGEDVGIADRFFIGGSRLRGFSFSGVGPRDTRTGDVLGGNVYWNATASLNVPLGLPRELGLRGRVFTDWGSLFNVDVTGADIVDESTPRGSVGVGFSYISPIGPMQFDFAWPVQKKDYDETDTFRFSVGTGF